MLGDNGGCEGAKASGPIVPNHMGLPIITDERMPKGMILLMGPNGEMYVL